MKENRHSAAIPQTVLDAARAKITEAAEALADYTVALTPQERQTMLKMGDKTLAFVERANEYAHGSPKIVPGYPDLADFDTDFHNAYNLWGLLTTLRQLAEAVEDTIMAAGGEAYHAALAVCHNVQAAARHTRHESDPRRPEKPPAPYRQETRRGGHGESRRTKWIITLLKRYCAIILLLIQVLKMEYNTPC